MDEKAALNIFYRNGAVDENTHVVYASGKHGSTYINKARVFANTLDTSRLCRAIAIQFRKDDIDVVAGPAQGGIILAQWTADHLRRLTQKRVAAIFADKSARYGGFEFKRGFGEYVPGKRILVLEDILTTGGSLKQVVDLTRTEGGMVVGAAVLWNRGAVTASDISAPPRFVSLINTTFPAWDKADCPLCKAAAGINTDVGRG